MKLLAKNRRAYFDYQINDKLMAGLVLTGAEVKSIKAGHASLKGAFISLHGDEAYLTNAHISPYGPAAGQAFDPTRSRKLLLHRKQLVDLIGGKVAGNWAVPLAMLEDRGLVKLEIGIGHSKKRYDKREAIKKRQTERETARQFRRA